MIRKLLLIFVFITQTLFAWEEAHFSFGTPPGYTYNPQTTYFQRGDYGSFYSPSEEQDDIFYYYFPYRWDSHQELRTDTTVQPYPANYNYQTYYNHSIKQQ